MAGRRVISLILCMGLFLTGCTPESSGKQGQTESDFVSISTSPDLSYEVPLSTPHILVDQIGYPASGEKTVIFQGEKLPDTFRVIDAESGEAVCTKNVEKQDKNLGYGDFSEWIGEGTYYIESSTLGRSYDFRIAKDVYGSLFADVIACFNQVQEKKLNVFLPTSEPEEKIIQGGWYTDTEGNQDMHKAAQTMMTVLLAWELYPASFEKSAEAEPEILQILRKQTEWMLSLQEEQTGGVYGGILADNGETPYSYRMEEVDLKASAGFAAALAKFSYNYKKYDQQYAAQCLKAADRAWKYVSKQQGIPEETHAKDNALEEAFFCAAAELYRASGQSAYHVPLKQALDAGVAPGENFWDTFGCITYLSTRHFVNVELCSKVMKQLLEYAEAVSERARTEAYFTEGNADFTNTEELLWNMVILSMADYVITNHEYATVIENYQHYFLGRNPKAVCLVQGEGCDSLLETESVIQEDILLNSYYICMLSQIINREK